MKRRVVFIVLLVIIISPGQIFGQPESLVLNKWITSWTLLGPLPLKKSVDELKHLTGFKKDFLLKYGGEMNSEIKAGQNVKVGKNKILLKIEERGNKWEFCARILPFDIETYIKSGPLFFKVVSFPEGGAELRCALEPGVLDNLFNAVKLEIYLREGNEDLIYQGGWRRKQKTALEIIDPGYKPYRLKNIAEEKDGKEWLKEIDFYAGKRIDYFLFKNNKTDYRIIVGEDASESEKWAASEMQKYLSKMSGADFRIEKDASELSGNEIIKREGISHLAESGKSHMDAFYEQVKNAK